MNREEIKYIKTENGYKVSMPLITDDELEKIDFNFHSIVDEYIKEFSNKREKTIEQRLIYYLQQENQQLKERIDKAIEYIESRARNAGVVLMPREKELIEILKGDSNE